jgi:ABC-2 type transport system ATP-binding protein
MSAILVENLVIRYRQAHGRLIEAVNGLSFSVEPGEIVGFVGPNGAGKSSTLKAIMGFVPPTEGRCEVFGHPAGAVAANSRIGFLPEVATYYPYLTPLETLSLYGSLQGLRGTALHRQAIELLELVGIADAATKQNRTLSKGMLQRVGIAQALLGSPEVLILDEVTSGLDPVGRHMLRQILLERHRQGCALFFSSHELAEVEAICQRLLVICKGKIIEQRTVEQLKDELRRFELCFHGNLPVLDLAFETEAHADGTITARFRDKEHLIRAIGRAHLSGTRILDIVSQDGSLEDYLVETIRRAA